MINAHKFIAGLLAAVLLTGVSATSFADGRPVVGVAEFKNSSGAAWWRGGVGHDLASMLTNELANSESFRVVERTKLSAVLNEQDLAASGRIAPGTGAKIGQVTGAQYLVLGTISAYEENTKGGGGGISFKGISIGGKKNEAYIAVDLRVVDTNTGEIAFNRTVEARSGGGGLKLGFFKNGLGGNLGGYEKTPAGKAIRAVMIEIIDYLDCSMVQQTGECEAEFKQKEKKRKKGLKNLIKLD